MAILKILIGGTMIWLATEFGKKSGALGGLILSLPITSIIALSWIWFETKDAAQVAAVSRETLIFVLPSLLFFVLLWGLLSRNINFYLSFTISVLLTLGAYFVFFKIRGEA